MAGITNKGKYRMLDVFFRGAASPTLFYVALCTSASAPGASKNVITDMVEIASGNGYSTGGASVARDSTDFDTLTEDDSASRGLIQIKDMVFTAVGGNLPSSGNGARYAVLLDSNSTASLREVYTFWDLTSDRTVSDTQTLTLQDLELRLNES